MSLHGWLEDSAKLCRLGRFGRRLLVVLAEQAQDGRGRGVLSLLLAVGDDEPGGDVAQAQALAALALRVSDARGDTMGILFDWSQS